MKILVAEDERATRARIVACLREFGHDPVEAVNGMEAWEIIQQRDIPIVITDWLMPEMDGATLVRRLRSQTGAGYVYVILLTSQSDTQDVVAGMDAGADDFMAKPFDKEELRARIRAGERVIRLERELAAKNRSLSAAYGKISAVNRQMKEELQSAALIQHSFLPTKLPHCEHAEFGWLYEPCEELGGDTLNIIPLSDQRYALYVLDVSGHGVSAALLSVQISRALSHVGKREDVSAPATPAGVAAMLNARFQMDTANNQYFTLLYGILDLKDRSFHYVSAGHPGPLLIRQGQEPVISESTPPAIGFFPNMTFKQRSQVFQPGDRFFLYSDGIFEIDDGRGIEWGEQGLAVAAKLTSHLPVAENLRAIRDAAKAWQHEAPMKDDVSIIGVQLA